MFKELIEYYIGYFQAQGEPAIKTICNCVVPSKVLLQEYKRFPPIETMSAKDKNELKLFVNEMFPDRSIEERVDCAKIIYTIGSSI